MHISAREENLFCLYFNFYFSSSFYILWLSKYQGKRKDKKRLHMMCIDEAGVIGGYVSSDIDRTLQKKNSSYSSSVIYFLFIFFSFSLSSHPRLLLFSDSFINKRTHLDEEDHNAIQQFWVKPAFRCKCNMDTDKESNQALQSTNFNEIILGKSLTKLYRVNLSKC